MVKSKSKIRIGVLISGGGTNLQAIIDRSTAGELDAEVVCVISIKADAFGQALRAKVLPLAQHPKLGRTGRPGLPASVRELIAHRHYIIFYRVLDEARTVEILRVRHTSRQVP